MTPCGLAGGLGVTKYRLRDLILEHGVSSIIRSEARSFVDTIYEKATVMAVLNLMKFWETLKASAQERFPALLFSERQWQVARRWA